MRRVPPRWLVGDPSAVTQVRSPDTATACGRLATRLDVTCSEPASIRATDGGCPTATHTASFAYAKPLGLLPTVISVFWLVAGLSRVTVPSAAFAVHTRPAPNATETGLFPTGSRMTWNVSGSTLTTELELVSVTQTQPPPTVTAASAPPIAIGRDALRPRESMRCSVPSVVFTTHAARSPNAIGPGAWPTSMNFGGRSLGVAELIHDTVRPPLSATHTPPPPTATPVGSAPTWIVSTMRPAGSIWTSASCSVLVAHIEPAPAATPPGRPPNGTWPTMWPDASRIPTTFALRLVGR